LRDVDEEDDEKETDDEKNKNKPPSQSQSQSQSHSKTSSSSSSSQQSQRKWVFVCVNVGDCKAFHYNATTGKVEEVTDSGRQNASDASDPGGRLGPQLDEDAPDLRNLRLFWKICSPSDLIFVTSDGVYDNLDPQQQGLDPEDLGLSQYESWDDIDGVLLKDIFADFRSEFLRLLFFDQQPTFVVPSPSSSSSSSSSFPPSGSQTSRFADASDQDIDLSIDIDDSDLAMMETGEGLNSKNTSSEIDDDNFEDNLFDFDYGEDYETDREFDNDDPLSLSVRGSRSVSMSSSSCSSYSPPKSDPGSPEKESNEGQRPSLSGLHSNLCYVVACKDQYQHIVQEKRRKKYQKRMQIKSVTPRLVTQVLLKHASENTQSSRDFLIHNPLSRLPTNYKVFPGKMDHTTCLCFRVGCVSATLQSSSSIILDDLSSSSLEHEQASSLSSCFDRDNNNNNNNVEKINKSISLAKIHSMTPRVSPTEIFSSLDFSTRVLESQTLSVLSSSAASLLSTSPPPASLNDLASLSRLSETKRWCLQTGSTEMLMIPSSKRGSTAAQQQQQQQQQQQAFTSQTSFDPCNSCHLLPITLYVPLSVCVFEKADRVFVFCHTIASGLLTCTADESRLFLQVDWDHDHNNHWNTLKVRFGDFSVIGTNEIEEPIERVVELPSKILPETRTVFHDTLTGLITFSFCKKPPEPLLVSTITLSDSPFHL